MEHEVLYGTYSSKPCGYCKRHQKGITWRQVKAKGCLQKQCWYFRKYEDHEIWKQRSLMKQRKKAKRQEMKEKYGV